MILSLSIVRLIGFYQEMDRNYEKYLGRKSNRIKIFQDGKSVFISKNSKKILEILARFYGEIVRFNVKASCQNGNQNIFSRF